MNKNNINIFFNKQLYPYYKIVKLNNNTKNNNTKNNNTKNNNTKNNKIERINNSKSNVILLSINTILNREIFNKYKSDFKIPYFINDDLNVQIIKQIFYYFVDIVPINNVCILHNDISKEDMTYFKNIKIWNYNEIDNKLNKKFDILYIDKDQDQDQDIIKYIYGMYDILKENGLFILTVNDLYTEVLTMELLTLISKSFDEMIIYRSNTDQLSNKKQYIFKRFKNNVTKKDLNLLKNSVNKSIGIKIDKTLKEEIIKSDIEIINNINNFINEADKIYNSNNNIIKNTINYSIQFCKMMSYNLINQRDIMNYYTLKPIFFPIYSFNDNKYIDPINFKVSKEGEYSITFPVEANIISNLIAKVFTTNITILDGTANNGGNTISFSRFFNNIISIELDKNNYEYLQHNISLYNIKNVQLINGDTLKYYTELKYDILFLDPPWGGTDYKRQSVLDLKLGNLYVRDMIVIMKRMGKKGIVFKLPKNFRLSEQFLIGEHLSIYRIKNYFCAIIRL